MKSNNLLYTILIFLVAMIIMGCSWEFFDPLNKPTGVVEQYVFEGTIQPAEIRYIDARGNDIYAFWLTDTVPPDSPVLIYFHGIDGNLSTYASQIKFLWDTGFNVLAIDYPESGMSRGNRSEEDLFSAARGALAWVRNRTPQPPPNETVVAYGFSLGAALALLLGEENPDIAVVCDGAFTSYREWMPVVSQIQFLLQSENRFDNLSRVPAVAGPKLFIHGTEDRQNPYWMGEKLYLAAAEPKRLVTVTGGGHMFSFQQSDTAVSDIRAALLSLSD